MNGRVQRTLLVSSLLLAATPLAAPARAGGGCHSDGPGSTETMVGTEVGMKNNCFTPAVLAVDPGATVRFHNKDRVSHVVVGTRWAAGDEVGPGGTAQSRFEQPGAYPYSCYLHPGMNGVILVGDSTAGAPPAPSASAGSTPLAASATSTGGPNLPPLALGALAGGAAGVAATRRRRRRFS